VSSRRSDKARKSSGPARIQAASSPPGSRARGSLGEIADPRARLAVLIVVLLLAAIVVIGADFVIETVFGSGSGSTGSPAPAATPVPTAALWVRP